MHARNRHATSRNFENKNDVGMIESRNDTFLRNEPGIVK